MSSNHFHFNLILNDKYFGNLAYSESYRPDYPSHFPQQPFFSTRAHRIESPAERPFYSSTDSPLSFSKRTASKEVALRTTARMHLLVTAFRMSIIGELQGQISRSESLFWSVTKKRPTRLSFKESSCQVLANNCTLPQSPSRPLVANKRDWTTPSNKTLQHDLCTCWAVRRPYILSSGDPADSTPTCLQISITTRLPRLRPACC